MAVPLQLQLFDAFLGTQEGIHPIILPDLFSSGGSKNVYIDKFGRVASLPGYLRRKSTAYTTDTGGSAAMVRGLLPYRGTAGGSTTRKLLIVLDDQVNEWEIWSSTDNGTTASFIYDAGAGSVGAVPDAAQFGDDLYITNGKVAPRVYDGTSIAAAGLTQSPTITSAESANSGNLIGNYRYKLVSTIAGVRQNGSAPSTSLLVSNKQADLSWTADANTNVDGYEIYRTTGTGFTYYYLTSIDGRTTVAYVDNISDSLLLENRVMEEHGDAPPTAYFCEPHKQRMWWMRTDTYPTRGYWSDPGKPKSVYSENYLDFSDSDTVGDVITGSVGNYEGLLIVFTEFAVWSVSGTGSIIGDITDWTKTRTNAQIGCVSHRSAARVPAGSKYSDQMGAIQTTSVSSIVYWTPLGDIRLFDGDNDLIISHPVRDTCRAFNYEHRHKIHCVQDSDNDQIIWFFPSGSSTEPNKAVCWNYRYGVWYKWETMPFGASVKLDTSTDAALILTGEALTSKGAFVYTFLTGTSFDGSAIDARWMTKTIYGQNEQGLPAMSHRKRWRWIDLLFRVDDNINVTVEWLSGNALDAAAPLGTAVVNPSYTYIVTSDGSIVTTSDGSSVILIPSIIQDKAFLKVGGDYVHDEGVRLRMSTNSTTATWALEGMQIAYQMLPGLKRRDQL